MGVDTKLFIQTEMTTLDEITPYVLRGITKYTAFVESPLKEQDINIEPNFSYQDSSKLEYAAFDFSFKFNGEEEMRRLLMCFSAHDGADLADGPKIHFILGHWGSSEMLMFFIGMEFAQFPTFFLPSDGRGVHKPIKEFTEFQKEYLKAKVKIL